MITLLVLTGIACFVCLIFGDGRPAQNMAIIAATLFAIVLCLRFLP